MSGNQPSQKALVVEAAVRLMVAVVLLALMLFLPAGRWDWWVGWALIAAMLVLVCINITVLSVKNPDVIRERMRGGKGVRRWDTVLASSMVPFALAVVLLGGFDERFGWSPPFALWVQIAGLGLFVLGDLIFLWAMAANKFFATMVRIQRERGHYVVTDGPYRCVRHPGYVGWCVMMIGLAVALGSLLGFIPAAILLGLMFVRTALEDRMLRRELAGYKEYAGRVRYRLIPGVW